MSELGPSEVADGSQPLRANSGLPPDVASSLAAVILAGGQARRLGGADKAEVVVGGRTLLTRALDAASPAAKRIVVGPRRDGVPPDVDQVRENPPGGGPVAAIDAGLQHVEAPMVVVLACDMPFVTADLVLELAASLGGKPAPKSSPAEYAIRPVDGVLLLDEAGHRQPLCAVYRTDALRVALRALPEVSGASLRALTAPLRLREIPVTGSAAVDCDTWESVAATRRQMEEP